MVRAFVLALIAMSWCDWPGSSLAAQDTPVLPVLRDMLSRKIIEELVQHDSEETAWRHEKSVDRQKWTQGKILGRPLRLASWTEQSKSWIWLESPKSTAQFDLKQLVIRDSRVHFAAQTVAQARFKVWGRIPKLIQASAGGTAHVKIDIEGSTAIGLGGLKDSQVTTFKLVLDDLQFNNDLAHPMEDLVKDALNDYAERKDEKLRKTLEKAIDRVRF